MDVLVFSAQRRIVGLNEPLDADVADCWLNKSATLHSTAILEHHQKLVVLKDFSNKSLC